MKLSDFDFELPEKLIATRPAKPRTASRLLVSEGGEITDTQFADLGKWLRPGDRLVLNNTKVLQARLQGMRRRVGVDGEAEAKIDVTLLSPNENGDWNALIKPLKKVKETESITFVQGFKAILLNKNNGQAILKFNVSGSAFDQALATYGQMPLPPYIATKRPADAQDLTDYQTVFAQHMGAVAAPTASLHFDRVLLDQLRAAGVSMTEVTLHVGAGTFMPVTVDDVADHKMHSEWGEITAQAAAEIADTKAAGGRVIPVGTTALRLIETAGLSGAIKPWVGPTDIFIKPGFKFQIADALITNFHLPKSTLMMLVSALMGQQQIRDIYAHAIAQNYRFFSYGDSSLLIP